MCVAGQPVQLLPEPAAGCGGLSAAAGPAGGPGGVGTRGDSGQRPATTGHLPARSVAPAVTKSSVI